MQQVNSLEREQSDPDAVPTKKQKLQPESSVNAQRMDERSDTPNEDQQEVEKMNEQSDGSSEKEAGLFVDVEADEDNESSSEKKSDIEEFDDEEKEKGVNSGGSSIKSFGSSEGSGNGAAANIEMSSPMQTK